ncbi:MAG: FAD-dependent oxidoreductase [Acidobacteriota bacterium]
MTLTRRDLVVRGAMASAALAAYPFEVRGASEEPLQREGSGKQVVVLGAGLAGLSAAWELSQAGHEVTILEAQTRPGGRVKTWREPFSDGLHVDIGASEIPDNHDQVLKYVDLFGLELIPWLDASVAGKGSVLHLNGKRIRTDSGQGAPLSLTDAEREMGNMGMVVKYYHHAVKEIGDPLSAGWPPPELARFDDLTVADLIRSKGASRDALKALKVQFFLDLPGNGVDETSALYLLRDSLLSPGGHQIHKLKGGMDKLPMAFAERLRENIHYGAVARRIEHGDEGVTVAYEQAGKVSRISGDHLVCTIPFSVLRFLEIEPAFSPPKQRAIQELAYCSNTRLFLQTDDRFWLEDGLSGFAYTDLPIKYVFDSTSDSEVGRGMLEIYTSGAEARRFAALNDDDRFELALRDLEKVYPNIRDHFEGGAIKCWDDDRWARGAYSYFRPSQMLELLPHIAPAEGRVHFAGEHASAYPHWMQGALESGNRVAHEINEA